MPRKISPTKQIESLLGTSDKTKQVERIQLLVQNAQTAHVAITVLYDGEVSLSIASANPLKPEAIKAILQMGVDEVTKQMVLYEEQKKIQKELQDYADEDPDKQVFDGDGNPVTPRKE